MADREKLKARFEELKASMEVGLFGTVGMDEVEAVLELIRETEPRVMTLEELQAIETPWERNTPPYFWMENRVGGGSFWVRWPNILYAMIWHKINGNRTYGSEWRVWNLKPTPEQMEETPWEEVHRET